MQYQDLKNFKVPETFRGKSKITVQLWWIVQSTLFAWSPQFMYSWRRFLLRLFGAKIGKGVLLRPTVKVTYPWNVEIGDYCWIGENCVIYNLGKIIIGNNVVLSHKVYLNTGGHDYTKPTFDIYAEPITLEDECWLTTDVYVGSGITVGKGTIVAARSSVLKDLPENKICVGTPAKPIKSRI